MDASKQKPMKLQDVHKAIDKAFGDGQYAKALDLCNYALAIQPNDAIIPRAKGKILGKMNDYQSSRECFSKSLKIFGPNAEDYLNRGLCHSELTQYEDAVADLTMGLQLMPNYASGYLQRGAAYWELRRWPEALKDFEKAHKLNPEDANAKWVLGLLQLQMGNFKDGWGNYDQRWGSNKFKSPRLQTKKPEFVTNRKFKSVLVWGEQGIGDQIIYGSMLPEILKRTGRVTAMVDQRLISLFQRSMPDIEFMSSIDRVRADDHEAHLPFASIGRVFIKQLDDIKKVVSRSFLKADPARVEAVRAELGLTDSDFVVGLSWGSQAIKIGPHKSCKLEELLPVLQIPGVKFVNLQYGDYSKELELLKQKHGIELLSAGSVDRFLDLDGMAALCSVCNVIVAVSSSTVHMAGALGVPVLLMDANKLWYWANKDGDQSLWYPSIRIFPREAMGKPWAPVIERVTETLKGMRDG